MEKFFDIVCRIGGLTPSAAVLVTTVRAIKHHGGRRGRPAGRTSTGCAAIEIGMANVRRHLGIVDEFGVPCVVAVNRRPGDTDEEVELVRTLALEAGAFARRDQRGLREGRGRRRRARRGGRRRVRAAEPASRMLYERRRPDRARRSRPSRSASTAPRTSSSIPPPSAKLDAVRAATASATSRSAWRRRISRCRPTRRCSTRPRTSRCRCVTSAPTPAPAGSSRCAATSPQMPGLGKTPAALNVDIDEHGRTVGLF